MIAAVMADATLDAQGLKCPLPVLRARKALRDVAVGSRLCVLATDASAPRDFAAFCRESGHELIESVEAAGIYRITIRRKV